MKLSCMKVLFTARLRFPADTTCSAPLFLIGDSHQEDSVHLVLTPQVVPSIRTLYNTGNCIGSDTLAIVTLNVLRLT
jgi:hypothetical protein